MALGVIPLTARSQSHAERIYRVALLHSIGKSQFRSSLRYATFKQRMAELGFAEGRSVVYDERYAEGLNERIPALAKELLELHPDAFFVPGGATPALDVKRLTTTIPIVVLNAGDPVGSGLVKSLVRPGGNVTGVANFAADLSPKLIELLRALVPQLSTVGFLITGPPTGYPTLYETLKKAAEGLGCKAVFKQFTRIEELSNAMQQFDEERCQGIIVPGAPLASNSAR